MKEISYEEEKILKIIRRETFKVRNHYQTRLPLRNQEMSLPKNRKMVEQRLFYLKRRFKTNYKFKEGCNKFIEEIIHQGYARESEKRKIDGRVWCLPHHGIYHPNKPKTLRVYLNSVQN